MATTETDVTQLKINRLTKTQYKAQTTIGANELSLINPEFTGSKALVTDANGDIVESAVTSTELAVLDGITATTTELNYTDGVTSNIQTQLNGKLTPSDVIDNVTSTTTNKPLSANQGKVLQDQITHLKSIGRFLSLWNASTGLAQTNPTTSPYVYQTGDYFIVGTVAAEGSTNYKPDGSSYTIGTASTVVETNDVKAGYIYYYDNISWNLVAVESSTVTDVQVNGTSVVTDGVGNVPLGSDSTFGAVKVDNSSITATNGVVSVNYNQTILISYSDGTSSVLTLSGQLT